MNLTGRLTARVLGRVALAVTARRNAIRPIRTVAPYATVEVVARSAPLMAQKFAEQLAKSMIVKNWPGGDAAMTEVLAAGPADVDVRGRQA